jgi:FtsZ-interacting cell division protein YlmF
VIKALARAIIKIQTRKRDDDKKNGQDVTCKKHAHTHKARQQPGEEESNSRQFNEQEVVEKRLLYNMRRGAIIRRDSNRKIDTRITTIFAFFFFPLSRCGRFFHCDS